MEPAGRVVSLVPQHHRGAGVRTPRGGRGRDGLVHPSRRPRRDLEARVRGTKNPNLDTIRALRPDVVIANHEENRELDVRRLRESGVRVEVTRIETVPEAVETFERLFDDVLGWERPDWLAEVRASCGAVRCPRSEPTVAIPVWRDPWMVVGAFDVHRRPGPAAGLGQRVRRQQPTAIRRSSRPRSRRPASTWCCSRTSPTSSPPRTVRRRSRAPRPGWSAGGCSRGTAPRCSRPGRCSPRRPGGGSRRSRDSRPLGQPAAQ